MPEVKFVHLAFEADPTRVEQVRDALHAIVSRFDFRLAFDLDRAWANDWWQAYYAPTVALDVDALRAAHTHWADVVETELDERPSALPATLPQEAPAVHWSMFLGNAQSLLEYVHVEMPDDLGENEELWPMIRSWGIRGRVDAAADALEVVLGHRPPFERQEFDEDLPEFSEANPIHLYELTADLVMYCSTADDPDIGVGCIRRLEDPDPYTPGVLTPEELTHSSQPRRAIDHWPNNDLWMPAGLTLDALVDPSWTPCSDFARVYPRPLSSGLMRGPVSFAMGPKLDQVTKPEFAARCAASREAGRAVVTWVSAEVS